MGHFLLTLMYRLIIYQLGLRTSLGLITTVEIVLNADSNGHNRLVIAIVNYQYSSS